MIRTHYGFRPQQGCGNTRYQTSRTLQKSKGVLQQGQSKNYNFESLDTILKNTIAPDTNYRRKQAI